MVPTAELPPTTPLTSQVTVASCAPVTTAAKFSDAPRATVAAVGEIETVIEARIETDTEAVFDGSASGVATIRTVAGDGGTAGAV